VDIVGGFDVHRKQITFDYMELETGEIHRGKIQPAQDRPTEPSTISRGKS
jgi:hypothetical protein